MSQPLYTLQDVTRRHDERIVLQVARLEINLGERVVLLGPTGAGKSTLLRLLAGVEPLTSGRVHFAGQPLHEGVPLEVQRRITLLFQKPILLNGSVRFNVEYGLRLRGTPDRAEAAQEWIKRLGLTTLAERSVRTLSGGEAHLVALARSLAVHPDVLLLDEPTSFLDPARVGLVEEVVRRFQAERRATVVWATHNLFQARRLAGRTLLLLDGREIEDAPAERFFHQPRDPRTAAFVRGEMIC